MKKLPLKEVDPLILPGSLEWEHKVSNYLLIAIIIANFVVIYQHTVVKSISAVIWRKLWFHSQSIIFPIKNIEKKG